MLAQSGSARPWSLTLYRQDGFTGRTTLPFGAGAAVIPNLPPPAPAQLALAITRYNAWVKGLPNMKNPAPWLNILPNSILGVPGIGNPFPGEPW